MSYKDRILELEARKAAGHDVPKAGSLHELSYCRKCGAGFNSTEPCPGKAVALDERLLCKVADCP